MASTVFLIGAEREGGKGSVCMTWWSCRRSYNNCVHELRKQSSLLPSMFALRSRLSNAPPPPPPPLKKKMVTAATAPKTSVPPFSFFALPPSFLTICLHVYIYYRTLAEYLKMYSLNRQLLSDCACLFLISLFKNGTIFLLMIEMYKEMTNL